MNKNGSHFRYYEYYEKIQIVPIVHLQRIFRSKLIL